MIVSASIPNNYIKENMLKSAITMTQSEAFAYYNGNKMNGIADNYADSIWLNVAWYMGEEIPFLASVNTRYYDGEKEWEGIGLYQAVTDESREANTDYTRYWHGTAGIIRMFHLFTDVNGIRSIGLVATLGLAAIIMILLIKDEKDSVAVAFFLSLCIIKIWNIRLSMEYQPAFILGFLMCILYLLFEKKGDDCLLSLSVVSGTAMAFFDFLTTETIAILLPLVLVITVRGLENRVERFGKSVVMIISQVLAWGMAYGMTILAKWFLATILTGENKFVMAIHMVGERIGGNKPGTGELNPVLQLLSAPAANLAVLFGANKRLDRTAIAIGIVFVVFFVGLSFFCIKYGKKERRAANGLLCLLGSVILVRYLVLNNHSYLHAFFTYRGMISLIMAMFSIVILNVEKLQLNKSGIRREE